MRGRSLRTPKREAAFLRFLAKGASVGEAAAAIGCSRQCAYDWRRSDDAFRLAWDDAVDQATEVIESVLYKQAKEGNLLACIFWLKSHKPGVYHRKQGIALGGDPGAPPIGLTVDDVVHFYMPPNGRDQPERDDLDEQHEPISIEGEAEAADAAAA